VFTGNEERIDHRAASVTSEARATGETRLACPRSTRGSVR
jgi:hypothetical protein